MTTNRVIDEMFMTIRAKAQRAIAYSNDEKVRMELLALLEHTVAFEIKVHQAMHDNESVAKLLIANGTELSEKVIAELGPVTEIINYNEDNAGNDS